MRKVKSKKIMGKTCKYTYTDLQDAMGLFVPSTFEIFIDKTLKGDDLAHTVLHEEFHAVWDRLGLGNTEISHDIQELIVDGLSKFVTEHYKLVDKPKKKS